MEVARLQHEEIKAKADEVNTLRSKVTKVEQQLERKGVEITKTIKILHGQLEDKDIEIQNAREKIQKLQEQLSKLSQEKDEVIATTEKDKEVAEEFYKDVLFQGFYQVWKHNKPLNLCFLTEEEQAEELANCERWAREEAAEEAAARANIASPSAALPEVALAIEVIEEPVIEPTEVADASVDV